MQESVMNRLPHKTAFIVRFDTTSDIESGVIEGKVEHVASFRTERFHSLDELLTFVNLMLRDARCEEVEQ